jgi:hypothetical protein
LVIFPDTLDRRPADDSLFAAACGYRESRRCVGPRGLGERRKIHYNVKDFSRRAISVMTANRLARRRVKAILSEVMCFIEFVANAAGFRAGQGNFGHGRAGKTPVS